MTVDAAATIESTPTGVRVVVADDDVVIYRRMAANLPCAGYRVVTAHDGARALAQAEETPPDLAIVDREMPRTHVRAGRAHIAMTGHNGEVSHAKAFGAGPRQGGADRRMAYGTEAIARFEDAAVKPMVAPPRVQPGAEVGARGERVLAGPWCHDRDRLQDRPLGAVRPTRVERVRHNLAGNAARYCNQGGSIVVASRLERRRTCRDLVTKSGSVPASSCGCPAAPDAFGGSAGRRGLG
ncbi:MAG TPA: response regulator [Kofleriaceae bacterium]